MKILITGSNGQLGKKLADILKNGHQLILTDIDNMDITNSKAVEKRVSEYKPDYIIHSAAYTQVDNAESNIDTCRKINYLGTKNIATIAKKYDIKLIYISTDFVFDGSKTVPYNENDEPRPLSVYGLTKYEGEEFIKNTCNKYYIIRTSWLFGEIPKGHPGTNFVETIIKLAKERTDLSVVSDQIGSPTYTGDLVKVILEIINKKPEFGIYHFSGTNECSWYDFAKEILEQEKIKIDLKQIKSDQYPQKAKRPTYSYLDKKKIENALNIRVRSWKDMLNEYLQNR
jgi:dTDP-4-dehydrorhamnose reductase